MNATVFVVGQNVCCDYYFEMVVRENLIVMNFNLTLCRIMYVNFTEPDFSSEICSRSVIQ